ncbi:MAG: hypothetical protein H0V17_15660 [Deltaproteobacteria bacterium]|nr:hypothetical protein [Deltaproteobacteria bacterium]
MRPRARLVTVMLVLASSIAYAQPDVPPAPPPDGPPPPAEPMPPAVRLDVQARFDPGALIDQLAVNAPMVERIAKGTFKRARRAISIGPTVGVYGGRFPDSEQTDVAITFGLGIEMFKIPILPSMELIKEIAVKRAKERLLAANPQPGNVDQLAREIWDDVINEILGMENIRGRRTEKPKLTLGLEGNRLLDSEVWGVRLRAGIGISKVTIAASFSTLFTDPDTSIYLGPEVVLHFMTTKKPRASVIDVFLRGDFELRNRDVENLDMYAVGVRFLLDVL